MKSKAQQAFEEKRKDYSDRDIQMESLYLQWLIQNKTERTRANTSSLVWFVIIGIIIMAVTTFLAVLGA